VNRSAQVRAARVAGGVLLLAAVVPALTAGAALAADAPAPADTAVVAVEAVDPSTAPTAYADEVAIGTAVKIAAPGVVKAADPTTSASPASAEAADESTATPSGAVVIETDSRQNASEDPTEVAVLGTKISSNELASTGPSRVATQALLALALIGLGLALRVGPGLVSAAAGRRH
jgi:hypothetical protein